MTCVICLPVITFSVMWPTMKNKIKYHTVGTVPKSNRHVEMSKSNRHVEMSKSIPLTHIHDPQFPGLIRAFQWKLVLWVDNFHIRARVAQ